MTVEVVADVAAVLLAHQGGWDETLMVLAPVVIVAALLHRANRRAKQHLARQAQAGDGGPPADPADPSGPAPPDHGRD